MHMGSFHILTGMVMQPPCGVPLRTLSGRAQGRGCVRGPYAHNAAGEAE